MTLSGLPGFYLMYFLLTLLLFLLFRRKLVGLNREIYIFIFLAVVLGGVIPFAIELLGAMTTLLIMLLVAGLLSFLIVRNLPEKKRVLELTKSNEEVDASQESTSKSEAEMNENSKGNFSALFTQQHTNTEQQAFGQDAIDQLLAEFRTAEKEAERPDTNISSQEQAESELAQSIAETKMDTEQLPKNREEVIEWDFFDETANQSAASSEQAESEPSQTEPVVEKAKLAPPDHEEDLITYSFDDEPAVSLDELPSDSPTFSYLGDQAEEDEEKTDDLVLYSNLQDVDQPSDELEQLEEENQPSDEPKKQQDENHFNDLDHLVFVEDQPTSEPVETSTDKIGNTADVSDFVLQDDLIVVDLAQDEDLTIGDLVFEEEPVAEDIADHEGALVDDDTAEEDEDPIDEVFTLEEDLIVSDLTNEEIIEIEDIVQQPVKVTQQLTFDDMQQVQYHYETAVAALGGKDFQRALPHLKAALDYPIPLGTRYLVTKDYVEMLKHMGLYKKAIQELQQLREQLSNNPENHHLEMEIMNHIKYIEIVTNLVRLNQKPNLPWYLIPKYIFDEARKAGEL
ncbi:hypothetical protein [Brevibacillus sp. SYSU BS000544]|uniref:hypothetical protein n=1 Tax=Brevibacillus sp. SYSU BS000544 TaxID=3416443 RepID=UPI003CE53597